MAHDTVFQVFIGALLANNFVLAMFLGLCPFLGVSGKLGTALPMGVATTFVMAVASLFAFTLNWLLGLLGLEFLRLISYIVVIASAVQLVEMVLKKHSPTLFRALGIYLPLITTNCAVLGVALIQTARDYSLWQSLAFAAGGGAGFTLALVLMAGLRERLQLVEVPEIARGSALTLMLAGVLSLAFMGFAGLGG
ncbi:MULTISPECIES: electron transport complex protein RnfA [Rubrivivax]|uniref:RnfABCDGE type electron transport complex subunit A n=1 Tax=Rubrivivax benzoatilyticus TaxID=316997 RepID=A0ABX0I1W7_9BURK|nr:MULTISPECIES: RnfABCDGE type electron transport complex subunit A [Rubrivivax]EGJ09657.1 electron transport complex, RnfABCDGE type, A subunit [Rubrivivax benzoatilyticus JA2 = ATCC BAA-35]MCC9597167.1 RnfABCDGE type electron transport complex subunit A [Rubrivivax sp. JA1055]MCC9646574.1 RnfABCDGE type electron transport complex subunit A [Rubrivivax sp. JA1029]NHL00138.1 RnfABCDGE type electron transport complex subunit A [Rubrivivax benzoatilyticus]NHL26083.1 RnfABCDGE type electron tran